MKMHEYQAQELLAEFNVPVLRGEVATSADEARAAAEKLGGRVVVKAQVHAGGRGKGRIIDDDGNEILQGGVKLADSAEAAGAYAEAMLGRLLQTHQTGPAGQRVRKVYISEAVADIRTELYVGLAVDRQQGAPVLMASSEGGVEIEEVARQTPEKIFKERLDPALGLHGYQARRLAFALGLQEYGKETHAQGVQVCQRLATLFLECDCSLAEINPLIVDGDGRVLALDAKINVDDNALFRHPRIAAFHDPEMQNPREEQAREHNLSYVGLDGQIGCLVNGAGLAMATMDIIKFHGGDPANFLDVGGGATQEMVTEAFKIITADERVRAILVNIFGGIAQCDVIAKGVLGAVADVGLKVPLVVRLEGSRSKEGREIIANSDLQVISASSMDEAAQKVVAASQGA